MAIVSAISHYRYYRRVYPRTEDAIIREPELQCDPDMEIWCVRPVEALL